MRNLYIKTNVLVNNWELKDMSIVDGDLVEAVHQKSIEERQRRENEAFVYNEMQKSQKK